MRWRRLNDGDGQRDGIPMRGIRRWPFSTPSPTPENRGTRTPSPTARRWSTSFASAGLKRGAIPPAPGNCAISCSCGRQPTACCRPSPQDGPRRARIHVGARGRDQGRRCRRDPGARARSGPLFEPGPLGGLHDTLVLELHGPAAIGRPFTAQGMPWLHAPVPRPRARARAPVVHDGPLRKPRQGARLSRPAPCRGMTAHPWYVRPCGVRSAPPPVFRADIVA
jgi:hypothetical protein